MATVSMRSKASYCSRVVGWISRPRGEPSSSTTGNHPSAVIVIVIGVVHPHVQERRGGIEHHRRAPVHVADRALVPEEVFGDLHVYDLNRNRDRSSSSARPGKAWRHRTSPPGSSPCC